jgi:hypothetical protein
MIIFIQHIDNSTACNCCVFLYSERQQPFCIDCTLREGLTDSSESNNLQLEGVKYCQSQFPCVRYYSVMHLLITFVIIIFIIFSIQSVFIADFVIFLCKNFSV